MLSHWMSDKNNAQRLNLTKPIRHLSSQRVTGILSQVLFLATHGTAFIFMILFLSCSVEAKDSLYLFRLGFSSKVFTHINENDARAAIKAWAEVIVRQKNLPKEISTVIFKTDEELQQALIAKKVDAVGMLITEYYRLHRKVPLDPIFIPSHLGNITERYVLLTHWESNIKTIAELRGRSLNIYMNPRASLAMLWIDTLLVQQGLPVTTSFAGKISWIGKLDKVLLPVFFRQTDACIITMSGFKTMIELNPQLAKQIIVLAESFEVVPAVFAIRKEYQSPHIDVFNELQNSPAGQQVLTIFKSDALVSRPRSTLESSLQLIELHEKITKVRKKP